MTGLKIHAPKVAQVVRRIPLADKLDAAAIVLTALAAGIWLTAKNLGWLP